MDMRHLYVFAIRLLLCFLVLMYYPQASVIYLSHGKVVDGEVRCVMLQCIVSDSTSVVSDAPDHHASPGIFGAKQSFLHWWAGVHIHPRYAASPMHDSLCLGRLLLDRPPSSAYLQLLCKFLTRNL